MSLLNNSKLEDITYQKTLLIIITSSSSRFDIKQYEEIKKSTKGSGENYNTGCLLIRFENDNRLMTVNIERQKELDTDPKTVLQIEFVGQLKNDNMQRIANESMFALTFSEKLKETKLKVSKGSATVLQKVANNQERELNQQI